MQSDPEKGQGQVGRISRFYLARYRFYAGLLLFVLVVGVPMLAVPGLRGRLLGRVGKLRAAAAGKSNTLPVSASVGQNTLPFPAQYERPVAPKPQLPQFPPIPGLVNLTHQPPATAPARPAQRPARARNESIPTTEPSQSAATTGQTPSPGAGQEAVTSNDPVYQQGTDAKEAYNILLASSATVRAIADGTYAPLGLRGWGAARRDEDTYWVRLSLSPSAGAAAADYIWQIKLSSREATPLNFNARTLSR